MKKLISATLGAAALLSSTSAFAGVDVVEAPTGFFAPGAGSTTSAPYYRFGGDDWGWTHGGIGGSITMADLFISAFDVDVATGGFSAEVDNIYALDSGTWVLLGNLTQTGNEVFSYSSFALGANFFDDIAAGLQVKMDIDATNVGWAVTLGKSVVTTEGTRPPNPNPGVPEPATWGMMLLGFGIVGAAMRRKQSAQVRFAF